MNPSTFLRFLSREFIKLTGVPAIILIEEYDEPCFSARRSELPVNEILYEPFLNQT